jgi:hypothetical protein
MHIHLLAAPEDESTNHSVEALSEGGLRVVALLEEVQPDVVEGVSEEVDVEASVNLHRLVKISTRSSTHTSRLVKRILSPSTYIT